MATAGIVVLVVAIDLRRPPSDQYSTRAAVAGIHVYQATVSKALAHTGIQCRFTPTCSYYGEVVIKRFGIAHGGWMAAKRIFRCGPWTPMGTLDPPPVALGTRH